MPNTPRRKICQLAPLRTDLEDDKLAHMQDPASRLCDDHLIRKFVTIVVMISPSTSSVNGRQAVLGYCEQALAYPDIISNLFLGNGGADIRPLSHDVGGLASGRPSAGCLRERKITLRFGDKPCQSGVLTKEGASSGTHKYNLGGGEGWFLSVD
jgi:hypothetical protein